MKIIIKILRKFITNYLISNKSTQIKSKDNNNIHYQHSIYEFFLRK